MSIGAEWAAVIVPCAVLGLVVGIVMEVLQSRRRAKAEVAAASMEVSRKQVLLMMNCTESGHDLEAGSSSFCSTPSADISETAQELEEEPTSPRSLHATTSAALPAYPTANRQILGDENMAMPYLDPATSRPLYETGPQQPMPYLTRVTATPYIDSNAAVPYVGEGTAESIADWGMPDDDDAKVPSPICRST